MSGAPRTGRPRASSRDTIAEAACELFLEQGYDDTSVAAIATRAGVSRSSFFNYFSSKSDILWGGLDERIRQLEETGGTQGPDPSLHESLMGIARDFEPDSLALALLDPAAMGLEEELEREASLRRTRIAHYVTGRLRSSGTSELRAEVIGAAYGGAVFAALTHWALKGPSRTALSVVLDEALAVASSWRTD